MPEWESSKSRQAAVLSREAWVNIHRPLDERGWIYYTTLTIVTVVSLAA